jgi:hypothetical protein
MIAVTTVIDNIYVKVSWTAPDNNGATITKYKVVLLASDSITWVESKYCESTDVALLTDMQCYVPMEELTGSRFNLP